ncbi:two-component system chemotaxis response regulator CheY [Desulfobaculum xiamenense]|uniref:Two-component system chemotaxis response regulator CheY n=1 Tax=Desulfobaculum xiamenense TaxID=995050 RepID=A0A846QNH2_9BACT|nr:response regulator [Desulfobaculum xiamenense]NJB68737.1 two-component system chemotaxis response regulator CheY [Desulfobaculum xiamenense]
MAIDRNLHIIVADRSETMQKHIRHILRAHGYTNVTLASNGIEVARLVHSSTVEFIVSAWNLPKIKGIDILRRIRSMEATRDIPFLMVTSRGDTSYVDAARRHGVSAYLVKPFTPDAFMRAFTAALTRHGLIAQA